MDWLAPIDAYCERTSAALWAEPVNALTNLAFLVAAAAMAVRLRGQPLPLARAMVAALAAIGIGSLLFHTAANRLTALLDVAAILAFILLYVFAATRDLLGARPLLAGLAALGFIPYTAALVPLFAWVPGLGASAGYAPVPLLILIYAALLRARAPETARGFMLGAGLLVLSLTFRTLDGPLCDRIPIGTHFLWHLLNAAMLAWMIEVYRRHLARAA